MSRQMALLWGGAALGLVLLSPWASELAGGLWSCSFKSLTGYACPTCGTTRAALLLARFDVVSALTHYPLPSLGWIAFLAGGWLAAAMSLAGRTPPAVPSRIPNWAKVALIVAVLANWAYAIVTGV